MKNRDNINQPEGTMIYDHEGLEAKYDEVTREIDAVFHELDGNHEHMRPEDVTELGHVLGRLKALLSGHGSRLSQWEKENS